MEEFNRTPLISLYEAAWRFAPARMKKRAREERAKQPSPIPPSATTSAAGQAISQAFGQTISLLRGLLDPCEPTREMQDRIISQLHEGRLEAWGLRTAPTVGLQPRPIPSFLFDGPKINLRRNSIENFGQKFEGVKVRPRMAEHKPQRQTPVAERNRNVGRQSKIVEIQRVIDDLAKDGVQISLLPRKQAYDRIRTHARKMGFNTGIGFSNSVLNRALVNAIGVRS